VVGELYSQIQDDPDLAPFFVGVELAEVMRHQRELVVTAVGGPSVYSGRAIREAHKGLAIEQHHLDRLYLHLGAALAAGGVAETDAEIVSSLVKRLWQAQFWSAATDV
jgi:hemoglobin